MPNSSTFKAILKERCPRCHRGAMFSHSAFNVRKFDEMPEHCPVCQFRYEVELGFYWGAMYISYGLAVGIVLAVGLVLYYLAGDPPLWVYAVTVTSAITLSTTILFRYARVLMLYLFGSVYFDPQINRS
jgi:uncharacterized protein (DUF983 family)